jgi:hypothetical protein
VWACGRIGVVDTVDGMDLVDGVGVEDGRGGGRARARPCRRGGIFSCGGAQGN